MFFKAFLIWLAIAALAVANGGFREAVLLPRFGDTAARALSTLSLSAVILIVAALRGRTI